MEATRAALPTPPPSPPGPLPSPASPASLSPPSVSSSSSPVQVKTSACDNVISIGETSAMTTAAPTATTMVVPAAPPPALGDSTVNASHDMTNNEYVRNATTTSASTPTMPNHQPMTTVNTAITTASLTSSSAMTPTTATYGGTNTQLVKPTATLTSMGEDKVSTAGPATTQKAKPTKKKAAADGEPVAKKSPRVRAPKSDQPKSEKRKVSPARSNGGNATPTNVAQAAAAAAAAASASAAAATSAPTSLPSMPTAPVSSNPTYASMSDNSGLAGQHELPPAQDTDLRKQFLQRIYRQLQMTHRNQDDTMVRRLATNIEIDICRRAADRNNYIALMNQQIHSLMQAELAHGSTGLQSSLYVPGSQGVPTSTAMGGAVLTSSGMAAQHDPLSAAYRHSGSALQNSSDAMQRTSTSSQGSFMSLLSSQAPVQSYDSNRAPHHQQYAPPQGLPPQARPSHYPQAGAAPGYSAQSQQIASSAGMKAENSGVPDQSNPPLHLNQQRAPAPQNPTSAPPEFAAQFQRLDRNGLVDLLWTQHKTVLQYQRRLAQLEVQLNARQASAVMPPATVPATTTGLPSAYYNASPRQPAVPAGVSPAVSAEAEAQRANDRRNARAAQHQQQPSPYDQYANQSNQAPPTPTGVVNPTLYWEKVRYLKDGYLRSLYIAHQALSQHSAPANSAQNAKAENVKHNISLACSILSETPQNMQPRPLEVLDSIEKFIQTTVVPIVRKVGPQMYSQQMPATSEAPQSHHAPPNHPAPSSNHQGSPAHQVPSGHQAHSQQMKNDYHESSRTSMDMSTGLSSQSAGAVPASSNEPPMGVAGAGAAGKGAAKAKGTATKSAGRKSPANGAKKVTTPKTTTPKPPKAAAKKRPTKAMKAEQQGDAMKSEVAAAAPESAPMDSAVKNESYGDPLKDRTELPSLNSGQITDDDSLNDFSDFADLDFGEDLQDPLSKVQGNKENTTGVNARKRSIEDV